MKTLAKFVFVIGLLVAILASSLNASDRCWYGPEIVISRRIIAEYVPVYHQVLFFERPLPPGSWVYHHGWYYYVPDRRPVFHDGYHSGMPRPWVPMGRPSQSEDFYLP